MKPMLRMSALALALASTTSLAASPAHVVPESIGYSRGVLRYSYQMTACGEAPQGTIVKIAPVRSEGGFAYSIELLDRAGEAGPCDEMITVNGSVNIAESLKQYLQRGDALLNPVHPGPYEITLPKPRVWLSN